MTTPRFVLRFSLRDLLVATAGAAVGLSVLCWKGWDPDERVVLAVWMSITGFGLCYAKCGGRRLLLAGVIGAGLGPAFAFWAYHQFMLAVWRRIDGSVHQFMSTAILCTTTLGAIAFLIAVGSFG